MIALNHTRGRDPNDTAMPALAIDHDAVRFIQRRIAGYAFFDGLHDAPFFFLPLGIEAVGLLAIVRARSVSFTLNSSITSRATSIRRRR